MGGIIQFEKRIFIGNSELKNGVCASNFTPNFPVNVKNKNWTGDFDNNWFDARNWCGGIPDSTEDIEIPSGMLIVYVRDNFS